MRQKPGVNNGSRSLFVGLWVPLPASLTWSILVIELVRFRMALKPSPRVWIRTGSGNERKGPGSFLSRHDPDGSGLQVIRSRSDEASGWDVRLRIGSRRLSAGTIADCGSTSPNAGLRKRGRSKPDRAYQNPERSGKFGVGRMLIAAVSARVRGPEGWLTPSSHTRRSHSPPSSAALSGWRDSSSSPLSGC